MEILNEAVKGVASAFVLLGLAYLLAHKIAERVMR